MNPLLFPSDGEAIANEPRHHLSENRPRGAAKQLVLPAEKLGERGEDWAEDVDETAAMPRDPFLSVALYGLFSKSSLHPPPGSALRANDRDRNWRSMDE